MLARDLAAVIIGGALLLVPGAAAIDLFNPDEPRDAEIAREMRVGGELVVPRFNDCPFLEKPPLYYWTALALSKAPGPGPELQARLPSVLAALGLLVVVYFIGRELRDRRTGRAAAFLLLTTFQFWWLGKRAILDMTLALFVGAVLLFFLLGLRRPQRQTRWFLAAGVAAAGAVLSKGVIGLLIPAVTIAVHLLWRREGRPLVRPAAITAMAIPLLALGAWVGALATRPDGACLVREFVVENHFKRFAGGGYGGHRQPFWYYLEGLVTDMQPWVLFVPAALVSLWPGLAPPVRARTESARAGSATGAPRRSFPQGRTAAPTSAEPSAHEVKRGKRAGERGSTPPGAAADGDGFLHAWLLAPLVLLSLASSKRSLYLLPLAPAVALLVAMWWRSPASPPLPAGSLAGARAVGARRLATWIPALFLLGLGIVAAAGLPLAVAALLTGRTPRSIGDWAGTLWEAPSGLPLGSALLAGVLAIGWLARRRPRRAAAASIILVWTVFLAVGAGLLPLAEPRLSARSIGEAMQDLRARGSGVAAAGLREGALGQFLFYSGGTVDWIARASRLPESECADCRLPITAAEYLAEPGPRACLMLEEEAGALRRGMRGGRILARGRVGGASYMLLANEAAASLSAPRGPRP